MKREVNEQMVASCSRFNAWEQNMDKTKVMGVGLDLYCHFKVSFISFKLCLTLARIFI